MDPIFLSRREFDSGAAHIAASQAQGQAQRARSEVDTLNSRIDRLALICEALWTLLRERVGISEDELLDRIRELDLSDGVLDGKVRRGVLECPECGRVLSKRNDRCLYCGVEVVKPPFESL